MEPRICLLVPCYNEGQTIRKVIEDFKAEIPSLEVCVYDNNSKDDTIAQALAAGATVREENRQGKGNVVRSMFRDIDADVYVMVDGDDTYPARFVRQLIDPVLKGEADMVIGDRLTNGTYYKENSRRFHGFGNNIVRFFVNKFFRVQIADVMTGYRAFSRRFVKAFPAHSEGFQLETEMTVFALERYFRVKQVPIDFKERPEGSFSKLNTVTDGFRVLMCIFNLYRHNKPLKLFSIIALLLFAGALASGIPPVLEYIEYHYVYKVPSFILSVTLVTMAVLSLVCGLILDTVNHNAKTDFEQRLKK